MEVVSSDGDHTSRRSCVSMEKGVLGLLKVESIIVTLDYF